MGSRLAKPALDLGIVTANAEPVIAFYVALVGMERLEPLVLPNIGTIHKLGAGESVLRVMVPAEPPESQTAAGLSARSGFRYMTLEVEDAAAAVEAARAHGGTIHLEPFQLRPGRIVAQVSDPDGNWIEIGQG